MQHVLASRAAPLTEHPKALTMDTTRLGGWLLLVAVGLAGSAAFSVVNLVQTFSVFPAVMANGYGGIVGSATAVDLAVLVFTIVAIVRLTGLRRDAPRLTMILLATRPCAIAFVALVALAVDAGILTEGTGGDIFRSGLYAAIWAPYFQKSVRVKLTFVR
jgi:hypothetical protein